MDIQFFHKRERKQQLFLFRNSHCDNEKEVIYEIRRCIKKTINSNDWERNNRFDNGDKRTIVIFIENAKENKGIVSEVYELHYLPSE